MGALSAEDRHTKGSKKEKEKKEEMP